MHAKVKAAKNDDDQASTHDVYQPPYLTRFSSISNHSGVFFSGPRPCWIVNERGAALLLPHKMRHVAPGSPRPLTSFAESVNNDFITVHERLDDGQRLTFFHNLDDVLQVSGLLPGGGLCAKKVELGVSVIKCEFVSDPGISSAEHPLYVLLVCNDRVKDMSMRNNENLLNESEEERVVRKREKHSNRLEREVDGDMQGHDNDIAWMKELA